MKRISKKAFMLLLVVSMLLSSIGTIMVSAEDVEVLYEMYVGNDLSNQENGTAVKSRGNGVQVLEQDNAYNATDLGGDDKTIYYQLDIGGLYHNPNYWAPFAGPIAYFYDEVAEEKMDHMVVNKITDILPTAWLSMDVMIDGVDGATVNLNDYYIVIGTDADWGGKVDGLKLYGITLSNYMTNADIGKFKRITLPLQDFREGDLDEHIIIQHTKVQETALLNTMSRCGGMGIMCAPQAEREIAEQGVLNNLYVDNIKVYSGKPVFYDTIFSLNGEPIENMQAGEININASIYGNTGTWIVAKYNSSEELIEIAELEEVDAMEASVSFFTTVTCTATDKIRTFFWKDLENLSPLVDAAELLPVQ